MIQSAYQMLGARVWWGRYWARFCTLVGDMARMAANYVGLSSLAAIAEYFGELYWRVGARLDGKDILSKFRLSGAETDFAYRAAAAEFRIIESGKLPVIIPPGGDVESLVQKLSAAEVSSGRLERELQSYVVKMPPKSQQKSINSQHVFFGAPKLRGDRFAVLRTQNFYSRDIGLLWDDAEYLGLDTSII